MAESKNYITKEGFENLRSEYSHLLNVERPKTVETVAWAAGNGDRSENGDYIYGKKRLREIDRRLRSLMKKMESAEVVDTNEISTDKVVFGAKVTVENEEGLRKTYQIVGEDEIDTEGSKISWKSPMARALLGKSVGAEVEVKLPKKEIYLEIIEIKN